MSHIPGGIQAWKSRPPETVAAKTVQKEVIPMILAGLVISGLVFAAFLVLVIGIRGTERHHGLRDPYGDGPAGTFARRVLGVYVRQAENREDSCSQVRR